MARLNTKIHQLLSEEVVEALHSKQIYTVIDFVKAETQHVVSVGRLNFREVLALKNFLLKKYSARAVNGLEWYKNTLNNTAIIPTGIQGVDKLLQGGLVSGNIYELCGLPASGKTQFVLTLARNVVQSTQQSVYFLDTKNDFSATRMKQMLGRLPEAQQTQCLERVIVNRTYTKYDVLNALYQLKSELEANLKLRLVIIDSLPSILLDCYDYYKNHALLNHLVNIMRYISDVHHVVFVVINLVRMWDDTGGNKKGYFEQVACGKYWFSVPNTRLKIEKLEAGVHRVTLLPSDNGADLQLTSEGFS